MKTALLLVSCVALAACLDRSVSKEDPITEGDGQPDARAGGRYPGEPDAGYHAADAPAHKPDARPPTPDAKPPTPDAKPPTPDAMTCSPYGELCEPGTERFCDGQTYCNWGVQTCGPDGQWGKCDETSQAPAGCQGPSYDESCCVAHGYCCQAWGGASAGDCPGVTPQCQGGGHH